LEMIYHPTKKVVAGSGIFKKKWYIIIIII
jgi:hypothetical protein